MVNNGILKSSIIILFCSYIVVTAQDKPWSELRFPKGFGWGVAESAWQVEGDEMTYKNEYGLVHTTQAVTNWTKWDERLGNKVGKACERWTRYESDVDLMKNCGFNICRISIEWSKIEPEKGKFNQAAMEHYSDYIDALKARGIEPWVMLFHHTWPEWVDKQGAFENPTTINDFVNFSVYVFKHLHTKVNYWMTINEPEGYAMQGRVLPWGISSRKERLSVSRESTA